MVFISGPIEHNTSLSDIYMYIHILKIMEYIMSFSNRVLVESTSVQGWLMNFLKDWAELQTLAYWVNDKNSSFGFCLIHTHQFIINVLNSWEPKLKKHTFITASRVG